MTIKTALVFTAILCAMAVPGFCATTFDFTGNGGSFSVTTPGGTTLSALSADFTNLQVAGDGANNGNYAITSIEWTISGGELTLYGDVTGLAGVSGTLGTAATELLQIAVANTTTQTSSQPASITFAAGTGDIKYGSTLLSDLGVSGDVGTCPANSCTFTGSGTASPFSLNSNTLDTTLVATPEPVSFLLTGGGLLFVGGLARRRRKA